MVMRYESIRGELSLPSLQELWQNGFGILEKGAECKVYREQPVLDPELQRAVPQRRGDCDGACGVDGERSGEPTILQETANAVVQRRSAFVITDSSADTQRGIGRHLQGLVSRHGP